MISKKSRKVIAAVLIGATVCASGTFAYFNSKVDLSNIGGVSDKATKALNITNGKVLITSKLNGVSGAVLSSLWSYDVARVSTINLRTSDPVFFGNLTNVTEVDKDDAKITEFSSAYVDANKSPDIIGLESDADVRTAIIDATTNVNKQQALVNALSDELAKSSPATTLNGTDIKYTDGNGAEQTYSNATNDVTVSTTALQTAQENLKTFKTTLATTRRTKRADIGDLVTSVVQLARPGDAFVLGEIDKDNVDEGGIVIENQSNITTKVGLRLKSNGTQEAQRKAIKKLNDAGWKVYLKIDTGSRKLMDGSTEITTYKDYAELDLDTFSTNILSIGDVEPGGDMFTIKMRVELPLDTTNAYQKLTNEFNDGANDLAFDILDLFEVVATQENNPGWTQKAYTPTSTEKFTDIDTKYSDRNEPGDNGAQHDQ